MGWHHQLVVMEKKVYWVVLRVEANVNAFLTPGWLAWPLYKLISPAELSLQLLLVWPVG